MTVQSGDASFEVRVVAGVSGGIESVVCSAENIPDDWHKPLVDAQRAERESPLS